MGFSEQHDFISVDEYIEGEQLSELRHEYIGGQVYPMSGGSEAHNMSCLNLASAFWNCFRGHPCRVFMADMKLRLNIVEDDIFYYPDLLVTCDPADAEKFYKTRPKVIVEVLSPLDGACRPPEEVSVLPAAIEPGGLCARRPRDNPRDRFQQGQ